MSQIKKTFENCKRLYSYTSPCANRDKEPLIIVKGLFSEGRISIPDDILEEANKICSECPDFEPI